ncbi:MAG: BamA/TamA family outer membrane protein [Firmicutes bacterium]|nr:BamA/TamA family outer membrane protein [Bacillota bacterium]
MRKLKRLACSGLLLLFLFLAGASLAQATEQPVVLAIEITGNRQITDETILRAVSNIRLGEALDETAVRKDLQAIQNLGYFSMVEADVAPLLGGIKIIITVYENPIIKEIRIAGLQKADPAEIIPYFTQKEGEVFNYVKFMNDLEKAAYDYQEKTGLQLVFLSTDEDIITPDGVVTLHLTEARVGRVILKGLEKTDEKVVRRELYLKEGEILDLNVLREDLQRLFRLQLFADIYPRFEYTTSPEIVNVILELKEGQTVGLNVGLTYDPRLARLAGNFVISDSNLLGLGQRISLELSSSPGLSQHTGFVFYEPWLDEKETSLWVNLYSRYDSELTVVTSDETYAEKRTGAKVTIGRPLLEELRASTSLQIEKVNDSRETGGEYWNNSVGLGVTYNKLIYKGFHATGGYWAGIEMAIHGGWLGGKYDFNQYIAEFKQFYSPWERTTLGYRVKAGTIVGTPGESDRFYLGGPLTVRGYRDRHTEGTKFFLGNVELRQQMPDNESLYLVAFYDVGSVDYKKFYHSYGIGVRYTVPLLGKLRLDYGWNGETGSPEIHFFIDEMF